MTRTAASWAKLLGERLQQARLNQNITQTNMAKRIGVSRRTVIHAEQGRATLETFIALLQVLGLEEQLDNFLPEQPVSPLQLAKLQARQRQRASGQVQSDDQEEAPW